MIVPRPGRHPAVRTAPHNPSLQASGRHRGQEWRSSQPIAPPAGTARLLSASSWPYERCPPPMADPELIAAVVVPLTLVGLTSCGKRKDRLRQSPGSSAHRPRYRRPVRPASSKRCWLRLVRHSGCRTSNRGFCGKIEIRLGRPGIFRKCRRDRFDDAVPAVQPQCVGVGLNGDGSGNRLRSSSSGENRAIGQRHQIGCCFRLLAVFVENDNVGGPLAFVTSTTLSR
jgi:hypothetical protein